jgi:DNA-directed RNA polymerase subunit RPC12/RpoP
MVKVIKDNGQPWTYQFTCGEKDCNSELEAGVTDVKRGDFGDFEQAQLAWYVKCPLCGHKNIVPEGLTNAAFWRARKEKKAEPETHLNYDH